MPYIDSKVSIKISEEKELELKTRLGKAIQIIPGKSESWLMVGFQDNYHLYFRGDNSMPCAFIEVKVFGREDQISFAKMTAEICDIYEDVLGIPKDHIYVKYEAVSSWGWNGNNF